jgi:hypothetical protein
VTAAGSAHFHAQLVMTAQGQTVTVSADGDANAGERRSRFSYSATYPAGRFHGSAVADTANGLVVYAHGTGLPPLSAGKTWMRLRGREAWPLFDPGVPLASVRAARLSRTAGAARFTLSGADARLLVPGAVGAGPLPATAWTDSNHRLVRFRLSTQVRLGSTAVHVTIDERFSQPGAPVHVVLPAESTVLDLATAKRAAAQEAAAKRLVRSAVPALEAWNADHHGSYAGATMKKLRYVYDSKLDTTHIRIVRTSVNTYCVEASSGGTTARKAGPSAPIVLGRC